MTAQDVRLIGCPHPLSITRDRIDRCVPEGATVLEHAAAMGWTEFACAEAWIDDRRVPVAEWQYAVPKAGQVLCLRSIPLDSGGSQNGKTALRIVAMLAVVVGSLVAPYLAPVGWGLVGSWTGAALSATLSVAGSLAINALIPPSRQLDDGRNAGLGNPSYSITGFQNALSPFGVVPQVLGKHRVYPPYAAQPFSEVVGENTYIRAAFTLGMGPLALSDLKIGETPISQFQDVEVEIRQGYPSDGPLTLIPDDVFEESLSILMSGNYQRRTTRSNTRRATLEWTFPQGLWLDYGEGITGWAVTFLVRYRLVGETVWTVPPLVDPGQYPEALTGFPDVHANLRFRADQLGTLHNGLVIQYEQTPIDSVHSTVLFGSDYPFTILDSGWHVFVSGAEGRTANELAWFLMAYRAFQASFGNAFPFSTTIRADIGGNGTGVLSSFTVTLAGGRNPINQFYVSRFSREPFVYGASVDFPSPGQYEVEVAFTQAFVPPIDTVYSESYWTKLGSVQDGIPIHLSGQCVVAMRIRSTGQLNGQLDAFNAIAETICLDWTGSTWIERPTNNVASIYRYILQGPANPRPKSDVRLDLPKIQAFHERCTANGFTFNAVIDQRTTVRQLRQEVLAAGRGSFGMHDMLYSVVEDLLQPIPAGLITARNASEFKGRKIFIDLPHARKIRFINEAKGYENDERIIPLDGYGVTGEDGVRRDAFGNPTTNPEATKFETADAGVGITNADQVWKLERYYQAVAVHRSESFEVMQDFEALRQTRGDRVEVAHDVMLVGLGSARVVEVTVDGSGNCTSITIDNTLVMESGKSYGARLIRRSDGLQYVHLLVTTPGEHHQLTLATPATPQQTPGVGDLVSLGEYGQETTSCLIKSIVPSRDYAARLLLVPYAPQVHDAVLGPIPPFSSIVTTPSQVTFAPPKPSVVLVRSDESVLVRDADGSWRSQIVITYSLPSGFVVQPTEIHARIRPSDSVGAYRHLVFRDVDAPVVIGDVVDGQAYDVLLRSVNAGSGRTSDWTTIAGHVVVGKTTPPPSVTTFLRDGDRLVWTYPNPPLDMWGFKLRRHFGTRSSWEDAQPLHDNVLVTQRYDLPHDTQTVTYLLKAVDVGGNESVSPAILVMNLGDLVFENLIFTNDKKVAGWPGTHNGVVSGGNLEAASVSTFWSGTDTLPFWTSNAALFWNDRYESLVYLTSLVPDADKVPSSVLLDLTVTAQSYAVEYRSSGDDLFWSGTDISLFWSGTNSNLFWSQAGSDWLPWLGRIDHASRQAYEWRVTTAPGLTKGVISKYQIKIDVPDLEERMEDVVIAAPGGTRLPLTKVFREIVNVRLTLQADGGTAITAKIEDKGIGGPPLSGGPLVKCYNASGTVVAGTIDAEVHGRPYA